MKLSASRVPVLGLQVSCLCVYVIYLLPALKLYIVQEGIRIRIFKKAVAVYNVFEIIHDGFYPGHCIEYLLRVCVKFVSQPKSAILFSD